MCTCPGVVAVGVDFLERIFTPSQVVMVGHWPFSMALILCFIKLINYVTYAGSENIVADLVKAKFKQLILVRKEQLIS